jgi:threonine synthase
MLFYSTNNKDHKVSLKDAVIRGLAPDNGLYMPEQIPTFNPEFIERLGTISFSDIAFSVAEKFVGKGDVPTDELKKIVENTITFDAPLVEIEKGIFALELFHGPTLAFKDFGARFMSQLLGYFAKKENKEIVILVATSGDTGSAVANGFLGVEGVKVVVLYPSGKVSDVQEKQFTTLGKNITALEISGTFDDCQRLVKQAFQDEDLRQQYFLTSANSINIARLIPQSFYYFYSYSRIHDKKNPIVFSVPSGNFGNLTGGLFAKRMGLPISRFIVSTNSNDVVPQYLASRVFSPRSSVSTISNAMDVGNPSNFARMLDLYANDFDALSKDVVGYSFNDDDTSNAIKSVFNESKYIMDPHGSVGYLGLKKYLSRNSNLTGVFLETAHPSKFIGAVENILNRRLDLPEALARFMKSEKISVPASTEYSEFKKVLKSVI